MSTHQVQVVVIQPTAEPITPLSNYSPMLEYVAAWWGSYNKNMVFHHFPYAFYTDSISLNKENPWAEVHAYLSQMGLKLPVLAILAGWDMTTAYGEGGHGLAIVGDHFLKGPPREAAATVAHELGHALYNLPHSPIRTDIMDATGIGFRQWPNCTFTPPPAWWQRLLARIKYGNSI